MNAFLRYPRTPRRTSRERLAAHFRQAAGSCLLPPADALVGVVRRSGASDAPAIRQPTHPAPGRPV